MERLSDALQNIVSLAQHLAVPESQHSKSLCFQPRIPDPVMFAARVLPTVHLDDQARLKADEIDDVGTEGDLATEFETSHLAHAQSAPKPPLGLGHVLAQSPGLSGLGCTLTPISAFPRQGGRGKTGRPDPLLLPPPRCLS